MVHNNTIAVIGGDLRQAHLAKSLCKDGFIVKIFGFDKGIDFKSDAVVCSSIKEAVNDCGLVVLPLPYSNDFININAPFSNNDIPINDLYKALNGCKLVVGGRLNDGVYNEAGRHGFKIIDYFEREELAVLNAIPTAEGAIQIAMEEMPITIHNSSCLVTGWGRISKVLSNCLYNLGAKVTVCARKVADLAWIKAYNYTPSPIYDLEKMACNYDVIFNTVPAMIIDEKVLKNVSSDTLIIDLASKPGGVDMQSAAKLNIKVIWALSLPGKVAPITSGDIIKDTVMNIVNEEAAE